VAVHNESSNQVVAPAAVVEYLNHFPRVSHGSNVTLDWTIDPILEPSFTSSNTSVQNVDLVADAIVSYKNITAQECFMIYEETEHLDDYGSVVYVVENITKGSQSIPSDFTILDIVQVHLQNPDNFYLGLDDDLSDGPDVVVTSYEQLDPSDDTQIGVIFEAQVVYCLAETIPPICELNYSREFLLTVVILNIMKAVLLFITAWIYTDEHIITVGDAIQYFLETPDVMVKNIATAGRKDFVKSNAKDVRDGSFQSLQNSPRALYMGVSRPWLHRRWFYGATKTTW